METFTKCFIFYSRFSQTNKSLLRMLIIFYPKSTMNEEVRFFFHLVSTSPSSVYVMGLSFDIYYGNNTLVSWIRFLNVCVCVWYTYSDMDRNNTTSKMNWKTLHQKKNNNHFQIFFAMNIVLRLWQHQNNEKKNQNNNNNIIDRMLYYSTYLKKDAMKAFVCYE